LLLGVVDAGEVVDVVEVVAGVVVVVAGVVVVTPGAVVLGPVPVVVVGSSRIGRSSSGSTATVVEET
jgi:hypothetical protein